MRRQALGWSNLFANLPLATHRLKQALLTTYAPPDGAFLVEELLPRLLGVGRRPGPEREHVGFLAEVVDALDGLSGRIVVVSSEVVDESQAPATTTYPWILRGPRVLGLRVGATGDRAHVQHAKLWLLHWEPRSKKGKERVTLAVSSANLSAAAFRGQIQAGWCQELSLRSPAAAPRGGWAPLDGFLAALEKETGGTRSLEPFRELLRRLPPPDKGVALVPCVPASTNPLFNLPRLQRVVSGGKPPGRVRVFVPFLGDWGDRAKSLYRELGLEKPGQLQIAWVAEGHPWAQDGRFAATASAVERLGARLKPYRAPAGKAPRLHDEQPSSDERWPHLKVYEFASAEGQPTDLLITSANLSPSAWGARNFELGVMLKGANLPAAGGQGNEYFSLSASWNGKRKHQVAEREGEVGGASILWTHASWDGQEVSVTVRTAGGRAPSVKVGGIRSGWKPVAVRRGRVSWTGRRAWSDVPGGSGSPPLLARIAVGDETREVAVLDERPDVDRIDVRVVEEVDAAALTLARDQLVLERHGATPMEDSDPPGNGATPWAGAGAVAGGTYVVLAFARGREWFAAIDAWQQRADRAGNGIERAAAGREGRALLEAFGRLADASYPNSAARERALPAAKAAWDELHVRLRRYIDDDI